MRVLARHLDREELAAGLDEIRQAPTDVGVLELIVRRPVVDGREVLDEAELSVDRGLVGDNWAERGSPIDAQLNVINARASRLVAGEADDDRALAGDQLHVDLDLSRDNLPTGTRLAIGDAVIEVTAKPHNGCPKFAARFGAEALRFVNTGAGAELRLRGINARVVTPGIVRRGDRVHRLPNAAGDGSSAD